MDLLSILDHIHIFNHFQTRNTISITIFSARYPANMPGGCSQNSADEISEKCVAELQKKRKKNQPVVLQDQSQTHG